MQTNSRLGYIDIAKGFSIMLMVFGHTYSTSGTNYIITWIYSFHMPLFFLTTGILYGLKARNQGELSWNFQHKFRTLRLRYNRDKSRNPPFYAGCGLVCPFVL